MIIPLRAEWVWRKHEALRWRHNGRDSISNDQPHNCLLYRLFRRRSKKTSKLRVTGLCVGNSPGRTCEFPAQMASNAENVSIWWRHHGYSFNIYQNRGDKSNWNPSVRKTMTALSQTVNTMAADDLTTQGAGASVLPKHSGLTIRSVIVSGRTCCS